MSKDEESRIEKARQKGAMCVSCKHFNTRRHYDCDRFKERLTLNDMPLAYCEGYSKKEHPVIPSRIGRRRVGTTP